MRIKRKNRMWHFCSVAYKLVTYILLQFCSQILFISENSQNQPQMIVQPFVVVVTFSYDWNTLKARTSFQVSDSEKLNSLSLQSAPSDSQNWWLSIIQIGKNHLKPGKMPPLCSCATDTDSTIHKATSPRIFLN